MNRRQYFGCIIAIFALVCAGSGTSSAQLGNLSRAVGMIKGDVVGEDGAPLSGINVTILRGTERVTTTKTKPDGKFTNILQPNGMYRFVVNETQYAYHEDTIMVPALDKYREFSLHIVLTRMHDGEAFSLDDPVFLPQSSTIGDAAMKRLDAIVDLLRHNVKLSLNVTVYPDWEIRSKKDAPQQTLVDGRATSMRSFLLGKSIPPSRYSVAIGTVVPPGKFKIAGVTPPTPPADASAKKGKKKKADAPVATKSNVLVPQYVEIVAHLAS